MKSKLKFINVGVVKTNFKRVRKKFFIIDPKLSDLIMTKLKTF
jgi:hypothetical protein